MIKFDSNHPGDYQHCGRMVLPWDLIMSDLQGVAEEQTKNWSILDNETYKDSATSIMNEYKQYGYNPYNTRSWKTTNFDPKITFSWEHQVTKQLPLDHAIVTIHRQDPGQVLPWHFDRFFMLKRLHPQDTREIWRFLVFMEDWKLGHFLQVGDSVLHHWKQGDTVVWRPDTLHLAANVGLEKKWTCNVTGFITA